jgi:hypothetical protein
MTIKELRSNFYKGRCNAHAWPGGYPVFAVMSDGEALCPDCVTQERAQLFRSTHQASRDGWAVAGFDINWEDASLYCSHCNKRIESAYAEDEAAGGDDSGDDSGDGMRLYGTGIKAVR